MDILAHPIADLKGVGSYRASLLYRAFKIESYGDFLSLYPIRYEDKSRIYSISELQVGMHSVQVAGRLTKLRKCKRGQREILIGELEDGKHTLLLLWLNKIGWISKKMKRSARYLVFGRPTHYKNKFSIIHPEATQITPYADLPRGILPIYPTTSELASKGLRSQEIAAMQQTLLREVAPYIKERLPSSLISTYRLLSRKEAIRYVHFAPTKELLARARYRLKLEELFFFQLQLLYRKTARRKILQGQRFTDRRLLSDAYRHLPFSLTDDQEKVLKEISDDMGSGRQMYRLLQGDVGSGKTIVAFLSMLLPIASGAQAIMLVPTEVLALQHYSSLSTIADALGISISLLTGATPMKRKREIYAGLSKGSIQVLIGTHALLSDKAVFSRLGIAIIDEQQRFGVAQRAKVWKREEELSPHLLVMTATPIPRTLAMTLYGDLDLSAIKEKPAGRKPIFTAHYYNRDRPKLIARIKAQVEAGEQVYIVYPRIFHACGEESYRNLMDGYKSLCCALPSVPVSLLHGRMEVEAKAYELGRFTRGETKIMMGTTILEVGINVPNATMMVIENGEAFGLSQLHQLRGRVGRDEKKAYCILVTNSDLSSAAKQRIDTILATQDGFEVASADLKLRGPGDVLGLKQSGSYKLELADIVKDRVLLQKAHDMAKAILDKDPELLESRALLSALEKSH